MDDPLSRSWSLLPFTDILADLRVTLLHQKSITFVGSERSELTSNHEWQNFCLQAVCLHFPEHARSPCLGKNLPLDILGINLKSLQTLIYSKVRQISTTKTLDIRPVSISSNFSHGKSANSTNFFRFNRAFRRRYIMRPETVYMETLKFEKKHA